MKIESFFVAALIFCVRAEQFSYEGYKVWSVTPRTEEQGKLLLEWEDHEAVDFWEQISRKGKSSRIMVAPDTQSEFEKFLKQNQIDHDLIIENVERAFERERQSKTVSAKHNQEFGSLSGFGNFNNYWSYSEVNRFLTHLTLYYGDVCHTETLGFSYEGLAMRALKIGTFDGTRPIAFFEAGVHAREWIAVMTALYAMEQLVVNYRSNLELQSINIIIIPVLNPDGYVYSHDHQRLWRKTRSPTTNSSCIGVDANRNFAHEWRVSTNPCSDTYGGVEPFTEPEARIVRDLYDRFGTQIKLHIGIHSYGLYFLYPWGYAFNHNVDNWEDHETVGNRFADTVHQVNGTTFVVGNAADLLYTAYGGGSDYAAFRGIEISSTIELPGGGSYGFDLPADRIQPVVTETWLGLEQILLYVAEVHGSA